MQTGCDERLSAPTICSRVGSASAFKNIDRRMTVATDAESMAAAHAFDPCRYGGSPAV